MRAELAKVGALLGFVGLIAAGTETASAAAARRQGGSGYSGVLSSNPSLRAQQLACDPDFPISGSTSVIYNPAIVSLGSDLGNGLGDSLIAGSGYSVTGLVEVVNDGVRRLQPLTPGSAFDPVGQETGYVQVVYTLLDGGEPGEVSLPQGFGVVDSDEAVDGVDTHAFTFRYVDGVAANIDATYTIYADLGDTHSGNRPDSLTAVDDNGQVFTLTPGQLQAAQVRGNVVPEPSSLALLGLCGAALLGRRRRA